MFLDPTSSTMSFGDLPSADQGRNVIVFTDRNLLLHTIAFLPNNGINIDMNIDIYSENKTIVRRKVSAIGFYAASQRYYFRFTPPSVIKEDVKEKMRSFSSVARLLSFKIKGQNGLRQNPALDYVFEANAFFSNAKKLRIMPVLSYLGLSSSLIAKDNREFPLDMDGLYFIKFKARINIKNKKISFKYVPENFSMNNKWFSLDFKYRKKSRTALALEQELRIKQPLITAQDYRQFKKAIEKALIVTKQQIILSVR